MILFVYLPVKAPLV